VASTVKLAAIVLLRKHKCMPSPGSLLLSLLIQVLLEKLPPVKMQNVTCHASTRELRFFPQLSHFGSNAHRSKLLPLNKLGSLGMADSLQVTVISLEVLLILLSSEAAESDPQRIPYVECTR
jgi:hypothetical protein